MASLNIFHHDPKKNFAHTVDPRIKLLIMIIAASSSLFVRPWGILFLFAVLLTTAAAAEIILRPLAKNGLPVWIFAVILFISRAAGTPGVSIITVFGAVFTAEGAVSGLLSAGRLVFLVLVSHCFISLTSLSDIQRAVGYFLSPLPFPAAPRTALLTGLSINLIPRLLDTAGEIREAGACRGLNIRRKPFRSLAVFTVLFMRKAVRRAGETAEALEARNFRYDRVWKPFSLERKDARVLAGAVLAVAGALAV